MDMMATTLLMGAPQLRAVPVTASYQHHERPCANPTTTGRRPGLTPHALVFCVRTIVIFSIPTVPS